MKRIKIRNKHAGSSFWSQGARFGVIRTWELRGRAQSRDPDLRWEGSAWPVLGPPPLSWYPGGHHEAVLGLPREARARTVGLLLHREELCLPPTSFRTKCWGCVRAESPPSMHTWMWGSGGSFAPTPHCLGWAAGWGLGRGQAHEHECVDFPEVMRTRPLSFICRLLVAQAWPTVRAAGEAGLDTRPVAT